MNVIFIMNYTNNFSVFHLKCFCVFNLILVVVVVVLINNFLAFILFNKNKCETKLKFVHRCTSVNLQQN